MMARKLSSEELIGEIKRLANTPTDPPTSKEMRRDGRYSTDPYYREFGSWDEALVAAGYEPVSGGLHDRVTQKQLVEEMREFADELGHPPTTEEMYQDGPYSDTTYRKRFGGWEEALSEAGLPTENVGGKKSNASYIEEIKRLGSELGRVPTFRDMESEGRFWPRQYIKKFGSWNNAVELAGFIPCSGGVGTGEDNPMWKGGHEKYYGASWVEQRRKARHRDGCRCVRCGASDEQHKQDHSEELHVHHIRPFRTFDNHTNANELSNLLTVCRDCHYEIEGLPIDNRGR